MAEAGDVVHSKHLLTLDGLRGVAALSVVLFHRRWWAPGGHFLDHAYMAVDFFFMLSGLVIDHAYRQQLGGPLSFGRFCLKRLVRLYPLIVVGGALGLLVARHNTTVPAGALFALSAMPAPSWVIASPFGFNAPSWSLFFEMVASLAFGAIGYRLNNLALAVTVALAGLTWVWAVVQHNSAGFGFSRGDVTWGFARVAFPFLSGMLLNRLREARSIGGLPFWLVSLLLVVTFAPSKFGIVIEPVYGAALVVIVFPALIYLSCGQQPAGRWRLLAAWSAFLSYPLYAIHYPLQDLAARHLLPTHDHLRLIASTAAIVVAAGLAGWADSRFRQWIGAKLHARSAGSLAF